MNKQPEDIDAIFSDIVHGAPELFDYDPYPIELEADLFKYPPIGHIALQGDFDSDYENNLQSTDSGVETDNAPSL